MTLLPVLAPGVGVPGEFGQRNALLLTHVNGTPNPAVILIDTFDFQCRHGLSISTPAAIAGLDLTFLAIGFTASGLQASNFEVVQFP